MISGWNQHIAVMSITDLRSCRAAIKAIKAVNPGLASIVLPQEVFHKIVKEADVRLNGYRVDGVVLYWSSEPPITSERNWNVNDSEGRPKKNIAKG